MGRSAGWETDQNGYRLRLKNLVTCQNKLGQVVFDRAANTLFSTSFCFI